MGAASQLKATSFIYCLICLTLYVYGIISAPYIPSQIEGIALPLDFMIGIPLGLYLLVIRPKGVTALYVIPAIWVGYALSVLTLGSPSSGILPYLISALIPIEAAIAIRECRKLIKVVKSAREENSDPMTWFKAAMFYLVLKDKPASMAAAELSIWYYALLSWRKKPYVFNNEIAFTYHNAGGYMNMMLGLILAFPIEIIGVHLLISQWNPLAACVITGLSIYAAIWLIGDARARVMRPIVISNKSLRLECGIQMHVTTPLSNIKTICKSEEELFDIPKGEKLNYGTFYQANTWVVFKNPVAASTILGEKNVRTIGLSLDDPNAFFRSIEAEL